jgi:hypothetical protein
MSTIKEKPGENAKPMRSKRPFTRDYALHKRNRENTPNLGKLAEILLFPLGGLFLLWLDQQHATH